MYGLKIGLLLISLGLFSNCSGKNQNDPKKQTEIKQKGVQTMSIQLSSPAFGEGEMIPERYTCDGADVSPALKWSAVPAGTKSLALICDDPDAPMGTWVHWVIYGISPDTYEMPESVPMNETVLKGARQGKNDFRRIGYGGPCPPRGPAHRYYFKLYALDADINLKAGATKKELLKLIENHILAKGQLMGKYSRK